LAGEFGAGRINGMILPSGLTRLTLSSELIILVSRISEIG
jgi:hypothetical protein